MLEYTDLLAAPATPPTKQVQYGPGPLHYGKLWLPHPGPSIRTTIVFIHGGCWLAEYNLDHASAAASALAAEGYVVWVPEYRRLGDSGGGWPGTFDDVAAAVDFVPTLAQVEPGIDPERVIVAGHSAGGQLALWVASRKRDDASRTLVAGSCAALPLLGVVSLAGITDLAAYGEGTGSCNASVAPLLGGPRQYERLRSVSPVECVPIGVPMHLVHGAADPIVPVAMATHFAARAQAAGDRANVTLVTNAGHYDLLAPGTPAWTAVLAAFRGISSPIVGYL